MKVKAYEFDTGDVVVARVGTYSSSILICDETNTMYITEDSVDGMIAALRKAQKWLKKNG